MRVRLLRKLLTALDSSCTDFPFARGCLSTKSCQTKDPERQSFGFTSVGSVEHPGIPNTLAQYGKVLLHPRLETDGGGIGLFFVVPGKSTGGVYA